MFLYLIFLFVLFFPLEFQLIILCLDYILFSKFLFYFFSIHILYPLNFYMKFLSLLHSQLFFLYILFHLKLFLLLREYVLTNPPVPSKISPKYLVTTTKIFIKFCSDNILSIGAPAVPEGSPSSLYFFIVAPILHNYISRTVVFCIIMLFFYFFNIFFCLTSCFYIKNICNKS